MRTFMYSLIIQNFEYPTQDCDRISSLFIPRDYITKARVYYT